MTAEKNNKENGKIWLITGLVGVAIFAVVSVLRYKSYMTYDPENAVLLKSLCDGCCIAAFVMIGIGLMTWASNTGFFDIFGYAAHSLLVLFTPLRKPQEHETFVEYKERKDGDRKKPLVCMVVIGLIFAALAVLLLFLYNGATR